LKSLTMEKLFRMRLNVISAGYEERGTGEEQCPEGDHRVPRRTSCLAATFTASEGESEGRESEDARLQARKVESGGGEGKGASVHARRSRV
jgi:hypothetical protein